MENKEEIIDSIMGILISNSEGITQNLGDASVGYADKVYINSFKKELSEFINSK